MFQAFVLDTMGIKQANNTHGQIVFRRAKPLRLAHFAFKKKKDIRSTGFSQI